MEETRVREVVNDRRYHEAPCGDMREAQEAIRGLVDDRRRLNGSIENINKRIDGLDDKLNGLALSTAESLGKMELSVTKTLFAMTWKVLLAVFSAGLGLGSAVMMWFVTKGP